MEEEKEVILFLTHVFNKQISKTISKLAKAFGKFGEIVILFHKNDQYSEIDNSIKYKTFYFSDDDLKSSGFKMLNNKIVPGSGHIPVLLFYREFPNYKNYWLIENDVRFSGKWSVLFSDFAKYPQDLLTSHIRFHYEEPTWPWWRIEGDDNKISLEDRLRSFNTIYRLSNRAALFLNTYLSKNIKGHYEVLFPTLLYHNTFTLLDFGGNGKFVPNELQNKYYISKTKKNKNLNSGTMRHRPPFFIYGFLRNKLYHPIKGFTSYLEHYKDRIRTILKK